MKKTENQILVIFGASGDLTARKLIPAILNLAKGGHLPENFVVLGASRSEWSDEQFRKSVITESKHLGDDLKKKHKKLITDFCNRLFYHELGSDQDADYGPLKKRIDDLNKTFKTDSNYIFYLL